MRRIIVYLLKNSEVLLYCYNLFFKLKNKKAFYKAMTIREQLSLFDYKELALPVPYYPIERQKDSNFYGYVHALKEYAHIDKIDASLEHGIYLGNRIAKDEHYSTYHSIIAMSQNRVDAFKSQGLKKQVIAIGPYIHYAAPILSPREFSKIKSELGKVLLVMPVHDAKSVKVTYNPINLMGFVNSIRRNYDTVLVCLYYRDILFSPSCVDYYEKENCKIVCAGSQYDLRFVNRLKSIIMLSDYVVSNSHGTNTGFCIFLGKPLTIVQDPDLKKKHSIYNDEIRMVRDEQVKEIESAFSEYSTIITEKQKEVVEKYWGASLVMRPDDLNRALTALNQF